MLKQKSNNGFSIAEIGVGIVIFTILLATAFLSPYTSLKNFRNQEKVHQVEMAFDSIINSAVIDYGVGGDSRIKYTIVLLSDHSNIISVYNYKETYPLDPEGVPVVIPVMKFDKVEDIRIDPSISIRIPDTINGQTLSLDGDTKTIGIKIIRPDNTLLAFDASDNYFQKLTDDQVTVTEQLIRDFGNINYRNASTSDTDYFNIRPGTIKELTNFSLNVYDKDNIIGTLYFKKINNRFEFINIKDGDIDTAVVEDEDDDGEDDE